MMNLSSLSRLYHALLALAGLAAAMIAASFFFQAFWGVAIGVGVLLVTVAAILFYRDAVAKLRICLSALDDASNGDLNARVIDLMKPFSDEIINDPAFKGSASIKAVLPALLPELSYDDLDIQEGASASRLWKEVTLTNPGAPEREKVYADLVAYCTRDTWAMVAIHREMQVM